MAHIDNLKIGSFRGIKNLEISGLNDVNIIVGDNNCGKTSILETIALLRNPNSFYNILKVARMRDFSAFNAVPMYENFLTLFPKDKIHINISAQVDFWNAEIDLIGEEKNIIIDPEEINRKRTGALYRKKDIPNDEIISFFGTLNACYGTDRVLLPVELNPYISALEISSHYKRATDFLEVVYLAPSAHMKNNVFGRIVKNPDYKKLCVRLIQMFDENITDLLYLKNENTFRAVEYVEHKSLGVMPLSTYGDGIKKVLSLANGIASAANGILLIDEIETSLNYKYYDDIFNFIIKTCRSFNVQVFITTHNIEAIDGILATQNYENDDEYDPISVVTLRKDSNDSDTKVRLLTGREVFKNRSKFGFEVRL